MHAHSDTSLVTLSCKNSEVTPLSVPGRTGSRGRQHPTEGFLPEFSAGLLSAC